MNKIFPLLLIITLSLISWTKDNSTIDPIVGTWSIFSENGIESSACEKNTPLIFNKNGTFTSIEYYYNEDNQECVKNGTFSSKWIAKGNNIYTTFNKEGSVNGVDAKIVFSDNNTTFTLIEKEDNAVTVFKRN